MDALYQDLQVFAVQTLLDVIRNGRVKLNGFDFRMEGVGRLLQPELAFA